MMTTDNLALTLYENPLSIQNKVISEFSSRMGLSDGDVIVDANNVFSFTLEMMSTLVANAITISANEFSSLYPLRAQVSKDLYKHMSNFDYVGLYSYPASTELTLWLDKQYLIDNALVKKNPDGSSTNYQEVYIPENSVFNIGAYQFGIYYPISIQINDKVKTVNAYYDTTNTNPLLSLSSNVVEVRSVKYHGLDLVAVKIPVYQFVVTTQLEDITQQTGFIKIYDYTDKFYAARIYMEKVSYDDEGNTSSEWVELNQTLSDDIYDPNIPTAKLVIEVDNQKLKVTIPQVYFDNGTIGDTVNRIRTDIYTTLGKMNVNISAIDPTQINARFTNSDTSEINEYSKILVKLPTIGLTANSSKIEGGSDGYTFNELKNRVINNSFYNDVMIREDQLTNYFSDKGFTITKYRDGITDRIFYASCNLTDYTGTVVAAGELSVKFLMSDLIRQDSSSIKDCGNGVYTLTPSLVYEYNTLDHATYPLTDSTIKEITSLSVADRVSRFNTHNYVISPYYTRVDTSTNNPIATTYDLSNPYTSNMLFTGDNTNITEQISLYKISIAHNLDQSSGDGVHYVNINGRLSTDMVELIQKKLNIEDITQISAEDLNTLSNNIKVVLATNDEYQKMVFKIYGNDTDTDIGSLFETLEDGSVLMHLFFTIPIQSTYNFSIDDKLEFTGFIDKNYNPDTYTTVSDAETVLNLQSGFSSSQTTSNSIKLDLTTTFNVIFMVSNEFLGSSGSSNIFDITKLPDIYQNYTPLTTQLVDITFGNVVNAVKNGVSVTHSSVSYKTYECTVFSTYPNDVYLTTTDPSTGLTEYVLDNNGKLVVEHYQGELIQNPQLLISHSYTDTNLKTQEHRATLLLTGGNSYPSKSDAWLTITTYDKDGNIVNESGEYQITTCNLLTQILEYIDSYNLIFDSYSEMIDVLSPITNTLGVKYDDNKSPFIFAICLKDTSSELPECILHKVSTATTGEKELISLKTSSEYGALYRRDPLNLSQWIKVVEFDTLDDLRNYSNTSEYAGIGYQIKTNSIVTHIQPLSFRYSESVYKLDLSNPMVEYVTNPFLEIAEQEVSPDKSKFVANINTIYNAHVDTTMTLPTLDATSEDVYTVGDRIVLRQHAGVGKVIYKDFVSSVYVVNDAENIGQEPEYREVIKVITPSKLLSGGAFVPKEIIFEYQVDGNGIPRWVELDIDARMTKHWPFECSGWYCVSNPISYTLHNVDSDYYIYPVDRIEVINSLYANYTKTLDESFVILNSFSNVNITDTDTVYWLESMSNDNVDIDTSNVYINLTGTKGFAKSDGKKLIVNFVATSYQVAAAWLRGLFDSYLTIDEKLHLSLDKSNNPCVTHNVSDTIVDENGNPIIDSSMLSRETIFYIDMLLVDAKFKYAFVKNSNEFNLKYISSIQELLQSYFVSIDSAIGELLDRSQLYFKPIRSIGEGVFITGSGTKVSIPLDISISLRLYVPKHVLSNDELKKMIRKNTISIIDRLLLLNVFSCTSVVNEMFSIMGDVITNIDILGINDDPSLQTLVSTETDVKPHLKHILSLLEDGSVVQDRALNLEYIYVE